ncbi:MAG: hypothetical protein WDO13_08030 [Verrucomicrobiota bacterium]
MAYAEWHHGVEAPITEVKGSGAPPRFLWTPQEPSTWSLLSYGSSKMPGVRHLRVGFEKPVTIGSILARGGGRVSVLKPDAAAPGDMADDSLWIPAQRLKDGKLCDNEAGPDDEVVWTLPRQSRRAPCASRTPPRRATGTTPGSCAASLCSLIAGRTPRRRRSLSPTRTSSAQPWSTPRVQTTAGAAGRTSPSAMTDTRRPWPRRPFGSC